MVTRAPPPQTVLEAPGEAALVALIGRIRFGDSAALGALYDAALDRIYGLALRVLKRPEDAEEVVGDVLMQVWDKAVDYCPERGAVMAWLLTLTWSRSIDCLRRQRRQNLEQPLHPDGLEDAYTPCEDHPADLIVDQLSRVQSLQRAFHHLSPIQRTVLELAYHEEFSQPEIAERIGLPLGTVKSHARRALTALRAALLAADDTP
jgi:RNA polymerase sigma-70 factor (ECF subfamily)